MSWMMWSSAPYGAVGPLPLLATAEVWRSPGRFLLEALLPPLMMHRGGSTTGGLDPVQCGAWSFGLVCRPCDAAPCAPAVLFRTPGSPGLTVTARSSPLAGQTRLVPLATVASHLSLTCRFPRRVLGMEPRLLAACHAQQFQFVEADIQAWILRAKVSRLPHSGEKHPLRLSITATVIRCLTRLLIRFPRRQGRSCPADEPPRTRHEPSHHRYHDWLHQFLHIVTQSLLATVSHSAPQHYTLVAPRAVKRKR